MASLRREGCMFDRYVSAKRSSWKRRAVLITSLALHGTAAVALTVASIFHVTEITPPPISIIFNHLPEPAPSGTPKKQPPTKVRRKEPPKTVASRPLTQPSPTPPPVAPPAVSPAPQSSDPGE